MKLPRWLRHFVSFMLVNGAVEWGGVIHDYANGNWKEVHRWTGESDEMAKSIMENMWNRGGSDIYIACVKTGAKDGAFMVTDSNRGLYERYFYHSIYEASEALKDVAVHCRKLADKMGYRRPENI